MATAAKADLTYHVDARLPVGDGVKETDSAHPKNVLKGLLQTQNQANTDSKYDATPQRLPPGAKEGFQSVMTNPAKTKQIFLISAILGIILCLVFVRQASNLFVKIAIVLVMVICIHYLLARLENRTV
jgi:Flp pilus assembly protein TadB